MDRKIIAGIDEVGRGCIAGAVFAAAVILDPEQPIDGLDDSKKLSEKKRVLLAEEIKKKSLSWAVARAEPCEIDRINILQASLLAMARAVQVLGVKPDWARVDGHQYPPLKIEGETVIKGDALFAEISAASILAKVARDKEMQFLDRLLPEYQFSRHKGYPTKLHLDMIRQSGISFWHRKTFAPVAKILNHSDFI